MSHHDTTCDECGADEASAHEPSELNLCASCANEQDRGGTPTLYVDGNAIHEDDRGRAIEGFTEPDARVQLEWTAVSNGYLPGRWNSAAIDFDHEADDGRTAVLRVSLSVGDPRGAFVMEYRVDKETGEAVLSVPHPSDGFLHMALTERSEGYYTVGGAS